MLEQFTIPDDRRRIEGWLGRPVSRACLPRWEV